MIITILSKAHYGAALYDMRTCSYLKVYVIPSLTAKKVMGLIKSENMIDYLKKHSGIDDVVTFGSIPGQYDVFIDTNDVNRVVREVRKRYEVIGVKSHGKKM